MSKTNDEEDYERMLKMPQQQYIRFLREFEGLNITEIKDTLGVDWRTAKKYADKEDWNKPLVRKGHISPVMEPFKEIVDTWLAEDQLLPRKQRHTATKAFNRLINEYNFPGSYRTVCAYIEKRKKEMEIEKTKAYEHLEHPGGEAQVDFCTIQVSKDSSLIDYKLLIMSFPFSNRAFVQPVPAENQECFLEALKKLFIKAGGIPTKIWFDNLSAAVAGIEKEGKRKLRELFARFQCHYRFEAIFCNPNKGNEKGNVENKCGYGRRNWCVPIPIFESYYELVKGLDALAVEDMAHPHYIKGTLVRELWQEEQSKLNKLSDIDFEVFHLDSAQINKYGEIVLDKLPIRVFKASPSDKVMLRFWWDKIDVIDTNYKTLTSIPRPYTGKVHEIPWVEVFKGYQRKPRSVSHSQFAKMLPQSFRDYIKTEDLTERKERIGAAINWCSVYTVKEISEVIEQFKDNATVTMITTLLSLTSGNSRQVQQGFKEDYTPPQIREIIPDLSIYNTLTKGGDTL